MDKTCPLGSQTIQIRHQGAQGALKTLPSGGYLDLSRIWVIPLKRAVTLLTYEDDGGIHNSIFVTNTPWALWVQSIMGRFDLGAS